MASRGFWQVGPAMLMWQLAGGSNDANVAAGRWVQRCWHGSWQVGPTMLTWQLIGGTQNNDMAFDRWGPRRWRVTFAWGRRRWRGIWQVGPATLMWQYVGGVVNDDMASACGAHDDDMSFFGRAHSELPCGLGGMWRRHQIFAWTNLKKIEIPRKLQNKIKWKQIFEMAGNLYI
jgi:hypothetical protein